MFRLASGIVLLLLLTTRFAQASGKELVIIDTDTTAFIPTTLDMEDDLAVLFTMASPEVKVLGLTITYGNGQQHETYADALHLKKLAGWDIPVLRGADYRKQDLTLVTEASQFIVDQALAHPEGITILALGAMTNLATAFTTHPEIIPFVTRIVMMGGNISKVNVDVNFAADARASNVVFNSPIPKIVVPTETCLQTVFGLSQALAVQRHPESVVYQFRLRIFTYLGVWKLAHDLIYPRKDYPDKVAGGFIPWDTISAAYLVKPELFRDEECYAVAMKAGKFTAEACDEVGDHRGKVTVPMTLERESFDKVLMERILSVKRQDRN